MNALKVILTALSFSATAYMSIAGLPLHFTAQIGSFNLKAKFSIFVSL